MPIFRVVSIEFVYYNSLEALLIFPRPVFLEYLFYISFMLFHGIDQLRSFISPEQKINGVQKKGNLTFGQMTGFRRNIETIIIGVIDQKAKNLGIVYKKEEPKKTRKRRRGPTVLSLCKEN